MCNIDTYRWVARNVSRDEIVGKRIVEVGSYDVNGSLRDVLGLLQPAEYMGVDIVEGPGVDKICRAENLVETFGEQSFDVVVTSSSMEHIEDWRTALSNMKRVCKNGGMLLFIAPSDWPFHEYPGDFWRYGPEDIREIFSDFDVLLLEEDKDIPSLVYAKLEKPESFSEADIANYKLFSVVANQRIVQHTPDLYKRIYFKRLVLKTKAKDLVLKWGKSIYPRI